VLYQDKLAEASLPNKLFDFMAAGIPFIDDNRSIVASQLVQDEQCGLILGGNDTESIASELKCFIKRILRSYVL